MHHVITGFLTVWLALFTMPASALAQSGAEESESAPKRLSHPELYGYGNDQDYPHMPACTPRNLGHPKGPKRCEFWKQEVTSLHEQLAARQARIATLTAQVADLEEQLAANEQQRRMLLTGLAQKDTQLHRTAADLEAARQQILHLEAVNAKLETAKAALEAEKATLEANKTALEAEKAALQGEKAKLEAETVVLQSTNKTLKGDNEKLETAKATLETEKATLEDENEDLDEIVSGVADGCTLFVSDDRTEFFVEGLDGWVPVLCVDVGETFPKLSAALGYQGTLYPGITVEKFINGYDLRTYKGAGRGYWYYEFRQYDGEWDIVASGYMTLDSSECSFNPSPTCRGTEPGFTHPTEAQGAILKEMLEVLPTLTYPTS